MYGTIALLHARAGHEDALMEMAEKWWGDRVGKVDGAISSEIRRSDVDPRRFFMIVTFKSKDQYVANASDPDQDSWYRQLVEHLTEEPEWLDGDIVAAFEARSSS